LLNSPEHRRLGSRNAENSQSTASTNEKSARRLTFDGSAVGLSGIQAALISKYSDSLSSSRALLSSTTRINRPRTTHDWHSKTGGPDGHLVGERSAALIQYEPVEPANTGVNKVVRGHLAKEIIQREVDSKPAVRRMRRVKSEAKLVPLKAIRLRLDGSIVGSQASMAHQTRDSSKQGMSYVVKDGLIRGVGGSHMDQRLGASQAAIARSGPSKSANASVYGEFNEIRARLQMAEDCKRQQQRANLSDRERADDMRIADIIENRQDIPLAAQLEERRNVQLAKQQALLQQQLEQQRQQLEQQRAFIEQQQQHQLFKRQSLHPSINSSSQVFAGAPAYDGQQQRGMYVGAMPAPSQYQPPAHHHGAYQHMQPVASIRGPNPHWAQQHSGSSGKLGRSSTNSSRLQPGVAFYKSTRPASAAAHSLHSMYSGASSDSSQSQAAAGTPARANTEINFDGSEYCPSTKSSVGLPPRRTSSYGYSSHQRAASAKQGSLSARHHIKAYDAEKAPPVPLLPHARVGGASPGGRVLHQEYVYPPPHGPPEYIPESVYDQGGNGYRQQAYSSQWAVGQPRTHGWIPQHGPLPPSQAALSRHSAYVHGYGGGGGIANQVNEAQMLADMQKLSKRRTEMAANTPSLLQRLDTARTSGLLPTRHTEKMGYSQGAYQNQSSSRVINEGSSAQYLGNGNTLLIDRVYESEKSRSAFLKKISRTYTGIGGDVAPATTF
ncbi:hypothetical protein GGI21_003868, partial [Coemansia aciculifera]